MQEFQIYICVCQCHSHTHTWVELGFHLLPFVGSKTWAVAYRPGGAWQDMAHCLVLVLCMVHFVHTQSGDDLTKAQPLK